MSQVCYYTCTLAPPSLIQRSGFVPRALLDVTANGDRRPPRAPSKPTILAHANTCPYVIDSLVEGERVLGADNSAVLVAPAGCDAMRRAGETLSATHPDRVYVYLVPRAGDEGSIAALTREFDRLTDWLEKRRTSTAHPTDFDEAPARNETGAPTPPRCDSPTSAPGTASYSYPHPPRPGGIFIVGGPMSHAPLLEMVGKLGVPISGAETCRGPECATRMDELTRSSSSSGDLAAGLLGHASCPRFSFSPRRSFLRRRLEETQASAVLYGRLPFCDPGVYDADAVRTLAQEMGIPFLEVEIDHPFEVDGRLRVRIEAFVEMLALKDSSLADDDLFDDLFDDDEPAKPQIGASTTPSGTGPSSATRAPKTAVRDSGDHSNGGDPAKLLAATLTRRALAARTILTAFKTGTARRYLEHYALDAALGLYKPGTFVPWVSYLFPPEILASYGLTPLIPEVAATTLAGTDFRDDLARAMNRQRLARDICSYHRAAKAALEAHLLPAPSICLGTTPLCLGKECMLDGIAAEFGIPFRSVRVPLPPDEGPAPQADIDDVAGQLRALHAYLGELTGRRPKLQKAVAYSNRASAVWSETCDRRLSGDLVLDGRQAFAFTFLGQVVWGSEEGAKGFERLRTIRGRSDLELTHPNGTARRRGNGRGHPTVRDPRPRILWLHTMPHHDPTLFDMIRAAGGAVVFEEMARVHLEPLDPRDPFTGMARRLVEHPMWGSAARRARTVLDLAARGDIDAVIHFNHWGCRHGLGTLPVLRDTLRAAGVPFLALDGDALDQPGGGVDSSAKQLESFLEML